ncbi:MAG: hypothetical protein ACR2IK_00430 [Chloroflexota bacterium]
MRSPLAEVPRDVIVSGTFQKVGGPTGGGYGLVVEDQGVGAGDGSISRVNSLSPQLAIAARSASGSAMA